MPVGGSAGSKGGGRSSQGSSTTKRGARACLRVSLDRRTVPLHRRTRVVATVRRGQRGAIGVRVVVKGAGVSAAGRTNAKGRAGINVLALERGRLTVRIRGERASCAARTVRAG